MLFVIWFWQVTVYSGFLKNDKKKTGTTEIVRFREVFGFIRVRFRQVLLYIGKSSNRFSKTAWPNLKKIHENDSMVTLYQNCKMFSVGLGKVLGVRKQVSKM